MTVIVMGRPYMEKVVMGDNTFDTSFTSGSDIEEDHIKQFAKALNGELIPRTGNAPSTINPNLGNDDHRWGEIHAEELFLKGNLFDSQAFFSPRNNILNNTAALYINERGDASFQSTSSDPFRAIINGKPYKAQVETRRLAVTLIPQSEERGITANININFTLTTIDNDDLYSRVGEIDVAASVLRGTPNTSEIDSTSKIILSLEDVYPPNFSDNDGKLIALTNQSSQGITLGRVRATTVGDDTTYELTEVRRGLAARGVGSWTGESVDLRYRLGIVWVYISVTGTITTSPNEPIRSVSTPDPSSGTHWISPRGIFTKGRNDIWLQADIILIGRFYTNSTSIVGAENFAPYKNYSNHNNINFELKNNKLYSLKSEQTCSVNGQMVDASFSFPHTLGTSVSGANFTYIYLDTDGRIHDLNRPPHYDPYRKGYYDPSITRLRCIGKIYKTVGGDHDSDNGRNLNIWEKYSPMGKIETRFSYYNPATRSARQERFHYLNPKGPVKSISRLERGIWVYTLKNDISLSSFKFNAFVTNGSTLNIALTFGRVSPGVASSPIILRVTIRDVSGGLDGSHTVIAERIGISKVQADLDNTYKG